MEILFKHKPSTGIISEIEKRTVQIYIIVLFWFERLIFSYGVSDKVHKPCQDQSPPSGVTPFTLDSILSTGRMDTSPPS